MKKNVKSVIGCLFRASMKIFPVRLKMIFMYHRVTRCMPTLLHDPHLYVTSGSLELHVRELKQFFEIVSLEELVSSDNNLPRSCSITFDDGWRDNYELALPIFIKHRICATIFLPVAAIGTNHWFWFEHIFYLANTVDREHFLAFFRKTIPAWSENTVTMDSILTLNEMLKCLSAQEISEIVDQAYVKLNIAIPEEPLLVDWEHVKEMGLSGIYFGSHGMNHDIIPLLDRASKLETVDASLRLLKEKGIRYTPFFSYPNGDWDGETIDMLQASGYIGATTTESGCAFSVPPFRLPRIGLSEVSANSTNLFWFQVARAFIDARRTGASRN